MRSRDKIRITIDPVRGKKWVTIHLLREDGKLVPSFEDHFRILLAIVQCEREKYPNLRWPPSRQLRSFLADAIDVIDRLLDQHPAGPSDEATDEAWHELATKYGLPR